MKDRIRELRRVRAGDITPDERNWRRHPPSQRRALRAALEEIGMADALIAREDGDGKLVLIDGHLRLEEAGPDDELPVLVLDVDEAEAGKLLATLDPLAAMAETDQSALDDLIGSLQATGDFAALLEDLASPPEVDLAGIDEPEEPPTKPVSKAGDLWILGDHRILCGNARSAEDVARVMGDDRAALVFTDPPYGVSYEARSGEHAVMAGDELRRDKLVALIQESLGLAAKHARDDAAFYVWHASATRDDFSYALKAAGLEEREYLIWAKPAIVLGHADYRWAHEPCFYAAKAGQAPAWHGGRDQGTVWRVAIHRAEGPAIAIGPGLLVTDGAGGELYITARPPKRRLRHVRIGKDDETIALTRDDEATTVWEVRRDHATMHPTQKPVELARRALENSTRPGEVVLDPFLGSGSTLIGAEITGRACRGTEKKPGYVDVVCRRWHRLTGQRPRREDGTAVDFS